MRYPSLHESLSAAWWFSLQMSSQMPKDHPHFHSHGASPPHFFLSLFYTVFYFWRSCYKLIPSPTKDWVIEDHIQEQRYELHIVGKSTNHDLGRYFHGFNDWRKEKQRYSYLIVPKAKSTTCSKFSNITMVAHNITKAESTLILSLKCQNQLWVSVVCFVF